MKNALLVVNALLVLAVGFLLYREFSGEKKELPKKTTGNTQTDSIGNRKLVLAYIETDSIEQKYELAKRVQDEIRKKQTSLNAEMERLERNYKNKLAGYQKKGPQMTEAEAEAARQDMESSQMEIMEKRQSLTEDYNNFVAQKNMSVINEIKDFLKEYNQDGRYSFIFSYEPALFYYRDSSFDITSDVLTGLNEKFKTKKK